MLIKIAGGVFVIAASTGLGLSLAGQWKTRLELLEQLRKMVFLLKGEILYANSPLEEAFERVGTKAAGVLGELFAAVAKRIRNQSGELFYTMWREEIEQIDKSVPLTKEDRQSLTSFGENLGYLDSQMQERTILLYLEQLDLSIAYLREHQREKSRLYTTLGIMGGLFLTIVMC